MYNFFHRSVDSIRKYHVDRHQINYKSIWRFERFTDISYRQHKIQTKNQMLWIAFNRFQCLYMYTIFSLDYSCCN